MAHAWQFHFGEPGRRGYHNKEWAEKMEAIGLMPSSTGKPGGAKTGEKMADYAIEGGPFMLATAGLLKTDFRISWLDRVTPANSSVTAILNGMEGGEDGEDSELAGMLTPATGSRSNREKYRCPCCRAQAWGKPGLSLVCGSEGCNAAPVRASRHIATVLPLFYGSQRLSTCIIYSLKTIIAFNRNDSGHL